MRTCFILLVAAASFITVGCASVDTATESAVNDRADVTHEIRAMNEAMENHYRNGEFLALSAIYADNAVLLGPNGYRVEGRDAIDAYWLRNADGLTDHDWQLTIDSLEGGPDLAVQHGTSTLEFTIASSGEHHVSIVDFMVVWQRMSADDAWKIVVDAYWRSAPSTSP